MEGCKESFRRVVSYPISSLLWSTVDRYHCIKSKRVIDLKYISERLTNGLYRTSVEYITDMRTLFRLYGNEGGKSPEKFAAAFLAGVFEESLKDLRPASILDTDDTELAKLKHKLSHDVSALDASFSQDVSSEGLTNGFRDCKMEPTKESILSVFKVLSVVPDYPMKFASFVYQFQPEAVSMGGGIYIDFSILSVDTMVRIQEFQRKMLNGGDKHNLC